MSMRRLQKLTKRKSEAAKVTLVINFEMNRLLVLAAASYLSLPAAWRVTRLFSILSDGGGHGVELAWRFRAAK
jgi:hypothetical protein